MSPQLNGFSLERSEVHWYCFACSMKKIEVNVVTNDMNNGWPMCPKCANEMAIDYWCEPGTLRVHHEERA